MFCIARFRRAKQPTTAPQPAAPTPDEPPAARFAWLVENQKDTPLMALATLRVGDYEVGEGYCPHLCGHPGIRY